MRKISNMLRATSLALFALTLPAWAGSSVWIVSNVECSGTNFRTIQEAIDVASEGDTILVRPSSLSNYGSIDIFRKSLKIIAANPNQFSAASLVENITIRGLLSSQAVTIVGISKTGGGIGIFEDNQGPIWIEEAEFGSPSTKFLSPDYESVRISNCASVIMVKATFAAPDYTAECDLLGPCFGIFGKDAMVIKDSEVHLYDCTLIGSDGGPGTDGITLGRVGGDGGVGARLVNSTLNVYGSTITGGKGGPGGNNAPQPHCSNGGPGGAAVHLSDTLSEVRVHDSTLTGGSGGFWSLGTPAPLGCADGAAAGAYGGLGAGNVTQIPGTLRGLMSLVNYPLIEGDPLVVTLKGTPGEFVFLGVAGIQHPSFDPILAGTTGFSPIVFVSLGIIGIGGSKALQFSLSEVTVPGESVTGYLQTYHFDASMKFVLGIPTSFTALDSDHDIMDGCDQKIYVDDDAPNDPGPNDPGVSDPSENGTMAHPYDSLQEGIDNATFFNSQVFVADGTYSNAPNSISTFGRGLHLRSLNGPDNCLIDGSGTPTALAFSGGSPIIPPLAGGSSGMPLELKGFTISGSTGDGILSDGSVIISDCIIENNVGSKGTGIRMGGGVVGTSGVISNCIIRNNSSLSTFVPGGAIFAKDRIITIANCLIYGNTSSDEGVVTLPRTDSVVRNSTIANNIGGGVFFTESGVDGAKSRLENCIVYGNSGGDQVAQIGGLKISYSDIEGGAMSIAGSLIIFGLGLIDVDPLFVAPMSGDFHLSAGSPCIDAGNPSFVPPLGEVDIDGDPRIQGVAVDLGSDET